MDRGTQLFCMHGMVEVVGTANERSRVRAWNLWGSDLLHGARRDRVRRNLRHRKRSRQYANRQSHSMHLPHPLGAPDPRSRFVVEKNHKYGDIVGSSEEPFINVLAKASAIRTDSHAVRTPAGRTTWRSLRARPSASAATHARSTSRRPISAASHSSVATRSPDYSENLPGRDTSAVAQRQSL